MALRNTAPLGARQPPLKVAFNWVTTAGANVLRTLPLGGAAGVVLSGIVLWVAPHVVPAGWSAEAVLSLGLGGGVVVHRLLDAALGWILEPAHRHLGARVEAWLRIAKVERYRRRGLLGDEQAKELLERIVRDDVGPAPRRRRGA
jgi:hypothetical protein